MNHKIVSLMRLGYDDGVAQNDLFLGGCANAYVTIYVCVCVSLERVPVEEDD